MNQLDWERAREDVAIADVARVEEGGTVFTFKNKGSLTAHLVSLWIINSTVHQRYDMDIIMNPGETFHYTRLDITIPEENYTVKVVTERGNIAIYSKD
jgi:hypothetical protein